MKMNKVKLGDMLTFQRGYDLTHSQMKNGKFPVVGSSEIIGYHDKANVKAPVLLIGRSGTVGRPQYYEIDIWAHNTTLFVSDFHGNDPKFCFYFLKNLNLENYANSSGVPTLNRNFIHPLIVNFPDLPTQSAIAQILSSLDEKIGLNNKINRELENFARTIYEYWFVQFDFPNNKRKPYKSSGGELVYNKILKYKIPKDWEPLKLNNIISRIGTGLNPRNNFKFGNGDNFYVTIRNISDGKIIIDDKCDKIDDESLKIINKRSDLQIGDTLFTSIEPVGTTYLIYRKPENWNINESVFTIRPNINKTTPEFLYHLLSSNLMKVFTKNFSTGSVHKGIRHGVLRTFPLAYPKDKRIINSFSMMTRPILEQIDNIDYESSILAKLRDFLLPLLMNGQVTVKNIKDNTDMTVLFKNKDNYDQRFNLWLKNKKFAARGETDLKTLREIFDAMDDDDK